MKYLLIFIIMILGIVIIGYNPTKVDNRRDYSYEAYCDSIYTADPVYYMDVLMESDEYCTYIEEHGKWW